MEAAVVEALEGAQLLCWGPAQSNVGLPCLFAVIVQPGMNACMVGGGLALVDGAGLGQEKGELASFCFVAVLVFELGRGATDGHTEGLARSLPLAADAPFEADQTLSISPPGWMSMYWTTPRAPLTKPSGTSRFLRSMTSAPTARRRSISRPPVSTDSSHAFSGGKGAPELREMSIGGLS